MLHFIRIPNVVCFEKFIHLEKFMGINSLLWNLVSLGGNKLFMQFGITSSSSVVMYSGTFDTTFTINWSKSRGCINSNCISDKASAYYNEQNEILYSLVQYDSDIMFTTQNSTNGEHINPTSG